MRRPLLHLPHVQLPAGARVSAYEDLLLCFPCCPRLKVSRAAFPIQHQEHLKWAASFAGVAACAPQTEQRRSRSPPGEAQLLLLQWRSSPVTSSACELPGTGRP